MLEEIRRNAENRLRQIEPLIQEARGLRNVLRAIEQDTLASSAATDSAVTNDVARLQPRAARRGTAAGTTSRAAKGSNMRVILEIVGRSPGMTAAQISELTGMKRTVVASTISRLKRRGELCEHANGGVRLAGRDAS